VPSQQAWYLAAINHGDENKKGDCVHGWMAGSRHLSAPVTKRALVGLRGWPRRLIDALRLRPHPRGRRGRPLFEITQARNTFTYSAACAPRGCRDPCWVAWLGRIGPSLPARPWPVMMRARTLAPGIFKRHLIRSRLTRKR
jgi:hypothetical protein